MPNKRNILYLFIQNTKRRIMYYNFLDFTYPSPKRPYFYGFVSQFILSSFLAFYISGVILSIIHFLFILNMLLLYSLYLASIVYVEEEVLFLFDYVYRYTSF